MATSQLGTIRGALRLIASMAVFGAMLFVTAGTAVWPAAWGYLVLTTAVLAAYATIMAKIHPDLIDERRHPPSDAKQWDKPFVAIVGGVGPFALLFVAGLDRRFHWSPPSSPWMEAAGLALVAAGGAWSNYAVATNRFFSALIRIQHDRGHRVVDSGPYRFVRHPSYLGSIVQMTGSGIALGSRPALWVTVGLSLVLVVRTALEDRTLRAELDGYEDYARRVRYKLLPGLFTILILLAPMAAMSAPV